MSPIKKTTLVHVLLFVLSKNMLSKAQYIKPEELYWEFHKNKTRQDKVVFTEGLISREPEINARAVPKLKFYV